MALAETHTVENLKAISRGDQPTIGGRSILLVFTGEQFARFEEVIIKWGAIPNGKGFVGKEAALIAAIDQQNYRRKFRDR